MNLTIRISIYRNMFKMLLLNKNENLFLNFNNFYEEIRLELFLVKKKKLTINFTIF